MLLKRLNLQRAHLYDDYPVKPRKNYWILIPILLISFGVIIYSVEEEINSQNLASKPLISPEVSRFTPGVGGGP